MRKLSVLGSTGSIGTQTLEVARRNRDDLRIAALSCGSDIDALLGQIIEFDPEVVSVADPDRADELRNRLKTSYPSVRTEVLQGREGNIACATLPSCDTVVGAMVGIKGLEPVYAGIMAGKDIALANKETLVTAGDIIMPKVTIMEDGSKRPMLLPVDSEHCAIWQCLWGEKRKNLDRILITASGGPFRGWTRKDLENVTVEQALAHPTWKMGGKITIDSATMMNKGLEVIEASHLFGLSPDKIDVVVHPQSVIHSMIRMKDGSVLAQMGRPSMILPIMVALYYPDRGNDLVEDFDPFAPGMNELTFDRCDTEVFGLLDDAYEAGKKGGFLPTVMNGANEVAVASFLGGKIGFTDIERTVKTVMDKMSGVTGKLTIESILECDSQARSYAREAIEGE
ncbi:MAG: 1-deoxy-D-xylulose-5-phosphate reductoisomerase [Clostridiales bacterium]|nr:1-deoxy-D-xylulose-5-phosphate reductoisomerase [Clostridiales bacterium]